MFTEQGTMIAYKPASWQRLQMGMVIRGPVYLPNYDEQGFWVFTESGIKLIPESYLQNEHFEKLKPDPFMYTAAAKLDKLIPDDYEDLPDMFDSQALAAGFGVQEDLDFSDEGKTQDKLLSGALIFFAGKTSDEGYVLHWGILVGILPDSLLVVSDSDYVRVEYGHVKNVYPRYKVAVRRLEQFLQRTASRSGV